MKPIHYDYLNYCGLRCTVRNFENLNYIMLNSCCIESEVSWVILYFTIRNKSWSGLYITCNYLEKFISCDSSYCDSVQVNLRCVMSRCRLSELCILYAAVSTFYHFRNKKGAPKLCDTLLIPFPHHCNLLIREQYNIIKITSPVIPKRIPVQKQAVFKDRQQLYGSTHATASGSNTLFRC